MLKDVYLMISQLDDQPSNSIQSTKANIYRRGYTKKAK